MDRASSSDKTVKVTGSNPARCLQINNEKNWIQLSDNEPDQLILEMAVEGPKLDSIVALIDPLHGSNTRFVSFLLYVTNTTTVY